MKTTSQAFQIILLSALVVCILAGCSSQTKAVGVLEGQVTIGPLVPVVREGEPEPTTAPEVYAARQILVYSRNGKQEIARLEIGPDGLYRAQLPAGVYVVDINRAGIDRAQGLPAEIVIITNQVTRLDIEIDTGIR